MASGTEAQPDVKLQNTEHGKTNRGHGPGGPPGGSTANSARKVWGSISRSSAPSAPSLGTPAAKQCEYLGQNTWISKERVRLGGQRQLPQESHSELPRVLVIVLFASGWPPVLSAPGPFHPQLCPRPSSGQCFLTPSAHLSHLWRSDLALLE